MIRADVHLPFFRKHLYLALGCIAYAAWCIYDALIGYPKKLKIAQAFESIPDDANKLEKWVEVASENGWSSRNPAKTADEVLGMIQGQYIYAMICVVIALVALILWVRAKGTWVEADETTIRNSRGSELPIDGITKIDKRKWTDKGIAKIHYSANGRSGRFVLDDFKYDTESVGKILNLAEANLEPNQIRGDKLERVKAQERAVQAELDEAEDQDGEADVEAGEGEVGEHDLAVDDVSQEINESSDKRQ